MGLDGNIGLDATRRPVRVPPAFAHYLEKHEIFTLFESLLTQMMIEKPSDPLEWMIHYLQRPKVCKVFVYGPPASGKRTVCNEIAKKSGAVVVDADELVQAAITAGSAAGKEAAAAVEAGNAVPDEIVVDLLAARLDKSDCRSQGFVVCGFPKTRTQAIALQVRGVLPIYFVVLDCPNEVVRQRAEGRSFDSSGAIYHDIFYPAAVGVETSKRDSDAPDAIMDQLTEFSRTKQDIEASYHSVIKRIDADQPLEDVIAAVWTTICTKPYSNAPTIPRLLLLGPPGAGKSTQAELLALKYNLVHVSLDELLKQAHGGLRSKAAAAVREAKKEQMAIPDLVLLELVTDRLASLDCQTNGWALEGFPATVAQAEMLRNRKFFASFVYFLDVPDDTVVDRLASRRIDPITGKRYHVGGMSLSEYLPPATEEEEERLATHPADNTERVLARLQESKEHGVALKAYYTGAATMINADQEAHAVFQSIDSRLVKPFLPAPATI